MGNNYQFYIILAKALYLLIVFSPLSYGIKLYFAELEKGNSHKLWEILGFFTSPKLMLRCIVHRTIFVVIVTISFIPEVLILAISFFSFSLALETESVALLALSFSTFSVSLALLLLTMIFLSRFSLATYIFITNPDISVFSTFNLSYKITKGKSVFLYKCKSKLFLASILTLFLMPINISISNITMSSVCNKICSNSTKCPSPIGKKNRM